MENSISTSITLPTQSIKEEDIVNPNTIIPGSSNNKIEQAVAKCPPDRIEYNVRDCVASFTGREVVIQELHEAIQKNRENGDLTILGQTGVFTGLGGIGKTETVRKYVQDNKANYGHVLWINAETYSEARNCFFNIAALTNIISFKKANNLKKDYEIIAEVYNFVCKKPTIIIFDNADSLLNEQGEDSMAVFLTRSTQTNRIKPAIVIISQNSQWKKHNLVALTGFVVVSRDSQWKKHQVITLTGFTHTESYKLLLDQLKFPDSEENCSLALEITNLSDGLPLIIQLVIGMIKTETEERAACGEDPYTMKDFLKDYHASDEDDKTDKTPDEINTNLDISPTVNRIINLIIDKLVKKTHGELALKCLTIASLLKPDCIPADLLLSLPKEDSRKEEVQKALSLLMNYNLLNVSNNCYYIHRMLQNVLLQIVRNYPPKIDDSRDPFVDFILYTYFGFMNYLTEMTPNTENKLEILENGMRFSQFAWTNLVTEDFDPKHYLFHTHLAEQLRQNEQYENEIIVKKKILELLSRHDEHEDIYETKRTIAFCYMQQGRLQEAEETNKHLIALIEEWNEQITIRRKNRKPYNDMEGKYFKVLESKSTNLGNGHYEDLLTKYHLGLTYKMQNKYDEAIKLYSDILKIQEQGFGTDYPNNRTLKFDLAVMYAYQQKFGNAESLLQDIHDKDKATLGDDHPKTLEAKAMLALMYNCGGKHGRAEKLTKALLTKQEPFFSVDHQTSMKIHYNLALTYEKQGKLNKAEQVLKKFIKKREEVLGRDHPDTLESKHYLALRYFDHKKLDEAEALLKETLDQRSKVLGSDHPDTLQTKSWLISTYNHQKKFDKASQLYADTLPETVDDDDNPDALMAKQNLGAALLGQGKFEEGEECLKEVLRRREAISDKDHPEILNTKHNLAASYMLQGEFHKASKYFKEVAQAREAVLGRDHPDTLKAKTTLVDSYVHQKNFDDAAELLQDIHKQHEASFGKDHPDTLTDKTYLASIYKKQGKFNEAEELYKDVIERQEAKLSKNHLETLATKHNLAVVYQSLENFPAAEALLKDILPHCESNLGKDDPNTLATQLSLATVYMRQGKFAEAEVLLKYNHLVSESTLGSAHEATLTVKHNLGKTFEMQGKFAEAEECFTEILKTLKTLPGNGHPDIDVLELKGDLVDIYVAQKKFLKAEVLLKNNLAERETTSGKEHPLTLNTKYKLGKVYSIQGKATEAAKCFAELLATETHTAVLGSGDPETLKLQDPLLEIYMDQKKFDKAEELLKGMFESRQVSLGNDHPETEATKTSLIWTYMKQGKFDKAEELLKSTRVKLETNLGKEHPDTVGSKNRLAMVCELQGKFGEAAELYKDVFQTRSRVLGSNHPDTLMALRQSLKTAYCSQGQSSKAQGKRFSKECQGKR